MARCTISKVNVLAMAEVVPMPVSRSRSFDKPSPAIQRPSSSSAMADLSRSGLPQNIGRCHGSSKAMPHSQVRPRRLTTALQRTEAGGGVSFDIHVLRRQPLSLSLSPLGPH